MFEEDTKEFYQKVLNLIDQYDEKQTLLMDKALIYAIIYWLTGKTFETENK